MYCLFVPTATVCEAKSVGLVRYPTTFVGLQAQLECADNAHSTRGSLTELCGSTGVWSVDTQHQCVCDDGYRVRTENGEDICEGLLSIYTYYF